MTGVEQLALIEGSVNGNAYKNIQENHRILSIPIPKKMTQSLKSKGNAFNFFVHNLLDNRKQW